MLDQHDTAAPTVLQEKALPPKMPARRARPRWLSWRQVKQWVSLAIVPGAIITFVLVLLVHRHSLDIEAIGVPDALSKAGFTSEIATQRLRAAIFAIQDRAGTTMAKIGVDTDQDWPDITIPKTGLSLQGVASTLRSLVPGWQQEIAGEFTQSGNKLSLQLRLNGRTIFSGVVATSDPSAADSLIGGLHGGAFKVVRDTQPYVAASALYGDSDSTAAEDLADEIITRFPVPGENVVRAYVLKGMIADDNREPDAAIADYLTAIRLDPRFAIAYNDLGTVYQKQGKLDTAIAQYLAAIRLNPKYATPHSNLGSAYDDKKKPNAAVAQYLTAIRIDPKNAEAHGNLGDSYRAQGKLGAAIVELQAAIQLDPKNSAYRYNMGLALEALAAKDKSRRPEVLQDACRAFVDSAKLPPADSDAPYAPDISVQIHTVDKMMGGQGHCPSDVPPPPRVPPA